MSNETQASEDYKERVKGDFAFTEYADGDTVISRLGREVAMVKRSQKRYVAEVTYNGQSSYSAAHDSKTAAILDAIWTASYYAYADTVNS